MRDDNEPRPMLRIYDAFSDAETVRGMAAVILWGHKPDPPHVSFDINAIGSGPVPKRAIARERVELGVLGLNAALTRYMKGSRQPETGKAEISKRKSLGLVKAEA